MSFSSNSPQSAVVACAFLASLVLGACTPKVELGKPPRVHVYACDQFVSQVRGAEDLEDVLRELPAVVERAAREKDVGSLMRFDAASSNMLAIEKAIVDYKCRLAREGKL